jgi:hypothetical protein
MGENRTTMVRGTDIIRVMEAETKKMDIMAGKRSPKLAVPIPLLVVQTLLSSVVL